ncbi:MAG: hypothetical protein U1E82_08010 [Nitrosomonas sp.]
MNDTNLTQIISLQFALFFRDIVDRPDIEFADLNTNMMNIFDAIPSIVPIPRELPPEVPIVTQRSESNEYVCNISRSRIDLHFQRIGDQRSNAELIVDFNAKVLGFIAYVLKKRSVIRFGMICRYFHEISTAVQAIRGKYFLGSIGDTEELSLRFNKKGTTLDWVINDIVEISAAAAVIDGKERLGIYIQRDINNNPQPNKELSEQVLRKISKEYSEHLTEKSIEGLIK